MNIYQRHLEAMHPSACSYCHQTVSRSNHRCSEGFYALVPMSHVREVNRFTVYLANMAENIAIRAHKAWARREP